MGRIAANIPAMLGYRAGTLEMLARWDIHRQDLATVLEDLKAAMAEMGTAHLPEEVQMAVPTLHEDLHTLTEDDRFLANWVGGTAEAILQADGLGHWLTGDLPVDAAPFPGIVEVDESRVDLGPAERSQVAPPLSLVEELEQAPELWQELDQLARQLLIEHYPDRIGSIDGLPTEARHQANMQVLEQEKEVLLAEQVRLQGEVDTLLADLGVEGVSSLDELSERTGNLQHLTEHEYSELLLLLIRMEEVDAQLGGIEAVESRINAPLEFFEHGDTHPDGAPPPAYLIGFGTEGHGQVILAVGDPDHADNVATYIPGMNTTLSGIGNNIQDLDILWSTATGKAPDEATSVILWFDYDAPQGMGEAMGEGPAVEAAGPLRDFLSGLEMSAVDGAVNRTLIGYSYGSTVIGHAATGGPLATDSIIFVGSPGVGTGHADDLGIDSERVYATTAAGDDISWVPFWIHNRSPVSQGFGAQEFPADPGDHGSYLEPDNTALDSIAAIITGHYDDVEPMPEALPTPRPDEVPPPTPSDGNAGPPSEPSPEPGPSPSPPGG